MTGSAPSDMLSNMFRLARKYKYLLAAALLLNLFLISQFFLVDLNLFRGSPSPTSPAQKGPGEKEVPPPAQPAHPEKPNLPPTATQTPSHGANVSPADHVGVPGAPSASSALSTTSSISLVSYTPSVPPPVPTSPIKGAVSLSNYDFDGEYIGWPLQRVCEETDWVPGLTFVCDNNSGGIGNIRNFILTCIRYAIDAGASELMMPRIQRRSETDLANIFTGGFHEFDYFFDKEHFLFVLSTFCPQMHVRQSPKELPHSNALVKVEEFYPKDLNADLDGCDGRGVNRHLDMFRTKFHQWLRKNNHMPTVETPVSIRLKWATFFEWPIYRDGPELANTFGDILRVRKDIKELAGIALGEMSKFVGKNTGEKDTVPTHFDAPYLGVHLRTEKDALGFWPSFEEQSTGYMQQGEKQKLKHAFLACGDSSEAKKFSDRAFNKTQLRVTTKQDLLKGDNLKKLNLLSWDQQALVDFLMLEKSAHFTGCSFSSFTMNVAFKRHLMTEGIVSRQWKSPGDKFTTLVGRFESWYGDWMFMYECMWP